MAACNSGLEPQVPTAALAPQATSCLSGSGKLIKLGGSYGSTVTVRGQSNAKVDARNARMLGVPSFVGTKNRNSFCLSGGTYDVGLSLSASWDRYHSSHGPIFFETPNATVENIAVVNAGDCISFKHGMSNWRFRDSYAKNCGDDGIENDRYSDGTVSNVLIDAAFMGFSCRSENRGTPRSYNTTIENSLIAMHPRNSAYMWKVTLGSSNRCKITIKNNVFYLPKNVGAMNPADLARVTTNPLNEAACRGNKNTIVYTGGDKRYLAELQRASPACFNVTTDKNVWLRARNAWFSSHPTFAKYR